MTRRQGVDRRCRSRVLRVIAYACVLAMIGTGSVQGQLSEPRMRQDAQSATTADESNGLVNVQQRDLLQRQAAGNWLSYNGDYSGARHSLISAQFG